MPWMKWQGTVLKRLGKIAISLACCCTDVCCICSWLYDLNQQDITTPGTGRIRVTFSGAISGYAILHADNTGEGHCFRWVTQTQADLDTMSDNCQLGPFNSVYFRCLLPVNNIRSYAQLEMYVSAGSAGCGIGPWTRTSASCGPPLSVSYSTTTVENVPGECNPCGDGAAITATVINEDPLL